MLDWSKIKLLNENQKQIIEELGKDPQRLFQVNPIEDMAEEARKIK
jgi:hypothetical protein